MPEDSEDIIEHWEARRRLVCIAASAVTTFYLYCVLILMSSTVNSSSQWADHKIEAVLQYFISKSEIGDAGNFKKKTYTSAAENIKGHTKTSEQVKTKWQGVSLLISSFKTDCD